MLRRSVALCDGPSLVRTLYSFNAPLRTLKYLSLPSDAFAPPQSIAIRAAVAGWNVIELPRAVALRSVEEANQLTVGPAPTGSTIITKRSLTRPTASSCGRSSFDCCHSPARVPARFFSSPAAASETTGGCSRYRAAGSRFGVELMEKPTKVACEQPAQIMLRARMWSVRIGDLELEDADNPRACA